MKSKFVIIFHSLFTAFLISIALWCAFNSLILLSILLFLLAITSSFALVGIIIYRKFMQKRILDPKRDLKRNYDKILIGEMSREAIVTENTLDLRSYHRNAYTDALLAKRYYSFLKQNGCIEIFVSTSKYYQSSNRINPIDYPLLHPVTLLENGIRPWTYKFALLNPIFGMLFIYSKYITVLNAKRRRIFNSSVFNPLVCFFEERSVILTIIAP